MLCEDRHAGKVPCLFESRDRNAAAVSQVASRIAGKLPEARKMQGGLPLTFSGEMTILTP